MTLPNVNTSLDDDTFFVDLNGELTADHTTIFFDFDGLIKAIGTTSERSSGILFVDNFQEWSNRLSGFESTGITNETIDTDVNTIFSYDFILKQPFVSKVPNSIRAESSYLYAKNYLPILNGYQELPNQESTDLVLNNNANISPEDLFMNVEGNINLSGSENLLESQIYYQFPNFRSRIFSSFNPDFLTGDLNIINEIYTQGLTFGNHLANQNLPRWPFGPVKNWDTLWWSVFNFMEYGGNAIIVAPDETGVTASKVNSVTNKLLSNQYSFDTITCLNGLDNEIARNIANQRRDCIAITTLATSQILGDEADGTGITGPTGITNKPEGVSGSGYLFKVVNAWLTGGAFGINGISSDLKYWENNNAVSTMSYPSGVGNYNPNTGGVTLSTDYGLGTGDMHLATTMMEFADIPIRSLPAFYNNETHIFSNYDAPGIDGHLITNTLVRNLLGLDIGGIYQLSGATTEGISGSLASDLPTQKIIVRTPSPNKNRSSADYTLGDLFYPAGDIKFYGKEGTTYSERLLEIIGNTEGSSLYNRILNGISGATGMNGGIVGSRWPDDNTPEAANVDGTGYLGGVGAFYDSDFFRWVYFYGFDGNLASNDSNNTIFSSSFNTKTDLPNLNINNRHRPFTPYFMDIRKTFDKAREQYNLTGMSRPTSENLIFAPSDSKSISSYHTTQLYKDFANYNQSALGVYHVPSNGRGLEIADRLFIQELDYALRGWHANRFETGEGFETLTGGPVITEFAVPNEHKNKFTAYAAEQNYLEFRHRSSSLIRGLDIYGSTLSNDPTGPGYFLREERDNGLNRFWGCTCADLPDFFRTVFEVGRTFGGIPANSNFPDTLNKAQFDESGYTPLRCIEFGPNETTAQVTAEGSTYCAFIGLEDRFQELYLDYRGTDGKMIGGTAQEFPDINPGEAITVTDPVGQSISWLTGETRDTHPGFARGGTFANMLLPYRCNEMLASNIRTPLIYYGGAFFGFDLVSYGFGVDFPSGMSIQFEAPTSEGGD